MENKKRKFEEDVDAKQASSVALYNSKHQSTSANVDPTYGQRSAFPGLDDIVVQDDDDELDYDEAVDAMAYLRAVRQEATSIPNVLFAPKSTSGRDIYEDGVGDYRGFYEDGAYLATREDEPPISEVQDDEVKADPTVAYFDSILARYKVLHTQLQQAPPDVAVKQLDKNHPTSLGKLETQVVKWWKWKMRTSEPLPIQVAAMDKDTVLKLLRLMCNGNLLQRGTKIQKGVSHWLWALLARLPDRGELMSYEISVLRELGKKAIVVGMGLRKDKTWEAGVSELDVTLDEYEDNEGEDNEVAKAPGDDASNIEASSSKLIGPQMVQHCDMHKAEFDAEQQAEQTRAELSIGSSIDITKKDSEVYAHESNSEIPMDEMAAAKARLLGKLQEEDQAEKLAIAAEIDASLQKTAAEETDALWNTKATIDMVLTIVGEIYGQRDLLELRSIWDAVM